MGGCRIAYVALGSLIVTASIDPLPAIAQQAGNRLLLRTGGPTASVRAIRFSPDSKHLYAAGIDKQIHRWKLRDRTGKFSPVHEQYIRWEISRAERGCIYAMDVDAGGNLAFGGYSTQGNSGDVVIYDLRQRAIDQVLPDTRPDTSDQPAMGHRHTVIAVSYSPNGKQLVTTSRDGETRLWTIADKGQNSQVLRRRKLEFGFPDGCFP